MEQVYKIKDSVDLYLTDDSLLTAYFMNTRQQKKFQVSHAMIKLIELIDGEKNVDEISNEMKIVGDFGFTEIQQILKSLEQQKIIIQKKEQDILEKQDLLRYDRQVNYFQEFFPEADGGLLAQKNLLKSKVAIFGCGAIGGDIAIILAMAGVRQFVLYDYDKVSESDVSRHMFHTKKSVGRNKNEALGEYLQRIDTKITIECVDGYLAPTTDISSLIENSDFVINTLDEPYIGYTSSKISRICVKFNKPHFIAGGFDAHLASTGELVIPFKTPCVECYTKYFSVALKDWKPKEHPVKERFNEIGGLASMSLFSASYAGIEILKYLAGLVDLEQSYKIRGEFLFGDMSLSYLDVEKNAECAVCGGEYAS